MEQINTIMQETSPAMNVSENLNKKIACSVHFQ